MDDIQEKGWNLLRQLNSVLAYEEPVVADPSTTARRILATYMRLPSQRPSKLHSAFLAAAVKMAVMFPEFQLAPFLEMWGLENLRPEDSDPFVTANGKRMPSTVERLAKAYAHSLLFHPQQHLAKELEDLLLPVLEKNGYVMSNLDGEHNTMLALRVFTTEKRGLHLTLVSLVSHDGTTATAEVHTITKYQHISYTDIPGSFFHVLLKRGDKGMRVEAAIKADEHPTLFTTEVGYVDYIDLKHDHIHIYDNHSRHFVATLTSRDFDISIGKFVRFVPVVPKESKFKSAFIRDVLNDEEGPSAFGYREARIQEVNKNISCASWELCSDGGEVKPIVELGTEKPSYTSGLIRGEMFKSCCYLMEKDRKVQLITFLKRGALGEKQPYVVKVKLANKD